MEFFKPLVRPGELHRNFIAVASPVRAAEHALFNSWANGMVDGDNKRVKEFQTTFNSTFWEVYLHGCFKEYGFGFDWTFPSPDFSLRAGGQKIVVEATTANAARGKPNEWDRTLGETELKKLARFKEMNFEAIIRLSNSITSKAKVLRDSYLQLEHVKGRPFVLAVAPFEQPHFILQFDRPIRALLYDYYVDEDACLANPEAYPDGPPAIKLGKIKKDGGAEIDLGLFNGHHFSEISAVLFSCTATWGKLTAMAKNPAFDVIVNSLWATPPAGAPKQRVCKGTESTETILDGLQVYHNPYANYPLPPSVFRHPGVVQHFISSDTREWVHEERMSSLLWRQPIVFPKGKAPPPEYYL